MNRPIISFALLAALGLSLFGINSICAQETQSTDNPQAEAARVVRVYILAGQSNMEGKARNSLYESQANDPATADLFAHLRRDGQWIERDDVSIQFLDRRGPLTIGYGSPDRTGVELELGTVLGDAHQDHVLLIKTAWGGHSLFRDFRPPSSGLPSEEALEEEWTKAAENTQRDNERNNRSNQPPSRDELRSRYGRSYRQMVEQVDRVLAQHETLFPELTGTKVEVAGFVWFQGWNDQYGSEHEYAGHLANLIRDVREQWKQPNLPFVIGVMGQNGSKPAEGAMKVIQDAQTSVAESEPFRANTRAVRTDQLVDTAAEALFPTWRDNVQAWEKVGSDFPYHYLGSAIWMNRIGRAMGEAMLEIESSQ